MPLSASDSEPAVEGRPLVLDGQRSGTRRRAWCERGPEHLRLVTSEGFVRPRCKRRDCPRCWALRSRELARCLVLDARQDAPTHCATLTTLDPSTSAEDFRRGVAQVAQRLRRRLGRVDYFAAIEFTTGKAARSGGQRRMHAHLLLKFRDRADVDVVAVEQLVRETWRSRTGAHVVEVAQLLSPGAALGYLGLHHRKPSQAPPSEWRGMTERSSRGYWSTPIADLRERARGELAAEAHAYRTGLPLELAALDVAAREPPRLIEVRRLGDAAVIEPLREVVRS
jgi:hypothetical protein